MGDVARRAERIAALLVGHALGCRFEDFDVQGRQRAVDFRAELSDGSVVALEVTILGSDRALEWDGLRRGDGGWWPAEGRWNYRPHSYKVSYRRARAAAVHLAASCEEQGVDEPELLEPQTCAEWAAISRHLQDLSGRLSRVPWEPRNGIRVYPPTRVEFVDEAGPDLSDLLDRWVDAPHVTPHLRKLQQSGADEQHLFLVVTSDMLPALMFGDGFPRPARSPQGFSGLHGLWIWSEFWHRYLVHRGNSWSWMEFPTAPGE